LLGIAGYFYFDISRNNKQVEVLEQAFSRAELELASFGGIRPDTLRINFLSKQITHLEDWAFDNSKFFLAADDSRISWAYLQNIIRRFNRNLDFNFTVVNRGSNQFDYTITGVTTIPYLNAFVNHIEKLGALYTIENLTISQTFRDTPTGPVNSINYTLTLRPWVDANLGKNLSETAMRRISYSRLPKDPFRPSIHSPMRIPSQEALISHANLKFISFTSQHAFFVDNNSTVIALSPLQRVAYGFFSHVDRENRAVFRINRTGLYETIHLTLQ
jgi:hypothetical protein